ncbi:MAG: hypothetical protein ABGX26_01730 [Nautiliaceae bacterium]
MKRVLVVGFLAVFLFIGCESKPEEVKITANEWIGYAPLFYANEKGWLKDDNIRLIRTVSLGESVRLYESGFVNSLAATQYEYSKLKNSVYPVLLLDRSYGGDMILSNKSLKEIKQSKNILVYLEIDSVNYLLLKTFARKYNINFKKFRFVNDDQQQITKEKFDLRKPILIVTYSPYDVCFYKKGFKVISSSKDDGLLIIDALFVAKNLKKSRFERLKFYIDKAVEIVKKNPKKVYETVRNYYPNYSYEDFLFAIKKIKWVNHPSSRLLDLLKKDNFPVQGLIGEN